MSVCDVYSHVGRGSGEKSDRVGVESFIHLVQFLAIQFLTSFGMDKDRLGFSALLQSCTSEGKMSSTVFGLDDEPR